MLHHDRHMPIHKYHNTVGHCPEDQTLDDYRHNHLQLNTAFDWHLTVKYRYAVHNQTDHLQIKPIYVLFRHKPYHAQ